MNIHDKNIIVNNQLKIQFISEHKFDLKLENYPYSPRYGVKLDSKILDIHLKEVIDKNKPLQIITRITTLKNYENN